MAIGSQGVTSPERERQIIKRLIEQQLYLDKQRLALYKQTGTSLALYSEPAFAVDIMEIVYDILGFPVDTSSFVATGIFPPDYPKEKLYSRPCLPAMHNIENNTIDDKLLDEIIDFLYMKLQHDKIQFPELFN